MTAVSERSAVDSVDPVEGDGGTGKRMIEWFSAKDAPGILESGIMKRATLNPEIAEQVDRTPMALGSKVHVLFCDESPNGFSLVHAWMGENYPLPRHTHGADCLYYVLKGELRMGSKVIPAGDGMFVPANRPYTFRAGPGGAEFLEFRATNRFDMTILDQTVEKWQGFVQIASGMQQAWQDTRPAD